LAIKEDKRGRRKATERLRSEISSIDMSKLPFSPTFLEQLLAFESSLVIMPGLPCQRAFFVYERNLNYNKAKLDEFNFSLQFQAS
jgi:hypothetical protein